MRRLAPSGSEALAVVLASTFAAAPALADGPPAGDTWDVWGEFGRSDPGPRLARLLPDWERSRTPRNLDAFQHSLLLAEQIKDAIRCEVDRTFPEPGDRSADAGAVPRALADQMLGFLREAVEFHLRPPPPRVEEAALLAVNASIDNGEVEFHALAYARVPRDGPLEPTPELAATDLVLAGRLLDMLAGTGTYSTAEAQLVWKGMDQRRQRILHDGLRAWLDRAEKEKNVELATKVRGELALQLEQQFGEGERDEAIRLWDDLRRDCLRFGDTPGFIAATVAQAGLYILKSQLDPAVALLREADAKLAAWPDAEMATNASRVWSSVKRVLPSVKPGGPNKEAVRAFAELRREVDDAAREPDGAVRRARLEALAAKPNLARYARVVLDRALFEEHVREGRLEEAQRVGDRLRAPLRETIGIPAEADLLARLLEVERGRGDLGRFEATAAEYEAIRRQLAGTRWRGGAARVLAEVAFALQDDEAAERHARAWIEDEYTDRVRSAAGDGHGSETLVNPEAELLLVRIEVDRGHLDEAKLQMDSFEAMGVAPSGTTGVLDEKQVRRANSVALRLAELEDAVGRSTDALARLHRLRPSIDKLERLNDFLDATLLEARVSLKMGLDTPDLVHEIEALAHNIAESPDLGALRAADMSLLLAEYHRRFHRPGPAKEWADEALHLAEHFGSIDHRILAHRVRGELAADAGDDVRAAAEYRKSIALLETISLSINGDVEKVGYRTERAKAIPLLVMNLFQRYRSAPQPELLDELLVNIERGKARALSEALFSPRGASLPAPREILRKLPRDTAILEYYVPEGAGDTPLRIVADSKGVSVEAVSVSSVELDAAVRSAIDAVANVGVSDQTRTQALLQQLSRTLLPAAWGSFERIPYRRLFVVAAGALHFLPLSLLVDERGVTLADRPIDIAYLPSLSAVALGAPVRPVRARAAAFLNPAGDPDHHDLLEAVPGTVRRLRDAFSRWSRGSTSIEEPLRTTELARRTKTLDHGFVYAHARFLPDDPLGSYVRLAPDGGDGEEGRLTARDLLRWHIGPGLWVLAACSTGVGRARSGDEVLGLPRALLEAGARSVVISLWDVGSSASLELMAAFYENLAAGHGVASALRLASNQLRRQGRPPFEWAPFIVIGQHDFRAH